MREYWNTGIMEWRKDGMAEEWNGMADVTAVGLACLAGGRDFWPAAKALRPSIS